MPPLARELYPHTRGMCPRHFGALEMCSGIGCAAVRAAFERSSAQLWAYWSSNDRRLYVLALADRLTADRLEARKAYASAA